MSGAPMTVDVIPRGCRNDGPHGAYRNAPNRHSREGGERESIGLNMTADGSMASKGGRLHGNGRPHGVSRNAPAVIPGKAGSGNPPA